MDSELHDKYQERFALIKKREAERKNLIEIKAAVGDTKDVEFEEGEICAVKPADDTKVDEKAVEEGEICESERKR
jgi:hypothetical protein